MPLNHNAAPNPAHLPPATMPSPSPFPRALRTAFGAGLLLAMAACVAPPPPIVLHPPVAARRLAPARARETTHTPRCERPARPALTEAEKTRLFDEFDGWEGDRRAPGATAGAPLPPPAPARNRAAPPGCRVSGD